MILTSACSYIALQAMHSFHPGPKSRVLPSQFPNLLEGALSLLYVLRLDVSRHK
jgi:hypothetical protein